MSDTLAIRLPADAGVDAADYIEGVIDLPPNAPIRVGQLVVVQDHSGAELARAMVVTVAPDGTHATLGAVL